MRWVVDDGPFGLLARHFDPGWIWKARTFEVMESVAAAAKSDQSGRRSKLLGLRVSEVEAISVRSLPIGSAAAEILFNYLRRSTPSATQDFGEDESIAYCLVDAPDAVFVTMDKQAAFLALAELGPGRVATPFDLWSWLADERIITMPARDALFSATHSNAREGLPGIPRRFHK